MISALYGGVAYEGAVLSHVIMQEPCYTHQFVAHGFPN